MGAKLPSEQRRRRGWIAAILVVPLGLLLIAIAGIACFFTAARVRSAGTTTRLAQAAATAAAQTSAAETRAPTPALTNIPLPTSALAFAAGEFARLYADETLLKVINDIEELIWAPPSESRFVAVNHRGQGDSGNIHLEGGTQLRFSAVTDAEIRLKLFAGSDLFLQTGPYPMGAQIELAGSPVVVSVRGCLAVYYPDDNTLIADCFDGICSFSTDHGAQSTALDGGRQIRLDLGQLTASGQEPIPQADHTKYWSLLNRTGAGRQDIARCRVPVPPTPTATLTATFTPGPTVAPYGGGFAGPDRPDEAERQREAATTRLLWRLSLAGYLVVWIAWLLSRLSARHAWRRPAEEPSR